MRTTDAFIVYTLPEQATKTVSELKHSDKIRHIYLLAPDANMLPIDGCELIPIDSLHSTVTIKKIAEKTAADYTLIYQKPTELQLGYLALERMLKIAQDADAGMVYADYYAMVGTEQKTHPVIDYQDGSLRDDFNFGALVIYRTDALVNAVKKMHTEYQFAGFYDLRLKISQNHPITHINEYLYTQAEQDTRLSGQKIFDYVNPKNRTVQMEMEQACTQHLKDIGAYLPPHFEEIVFGKDDFEYEASVIIPVRNRIRTIKDAIQSVLKQKTNFKFNLIIIDNHSTDGTTEVINQFRNDDRLLHIIPDRYDLGIGGCWNMGVHHPKCGKFSIQLDSDDVYSDEQTLQKIVNTFYEEQCAMVVGTYQMTNFELEEIPPGIIDHREWTPQNGRNNALRINGLGAPRAFYTPVLRKVRVPNTSYGEDYAVGLNISRHYQIGRIYDVLYLCRRWEDNSDASLDVEKMNRHNFYKDKIRTWELQARKRLKK